MKRSKATAAKDKIEAPQDRMSRRVETEHISSWVRLAGRSNDVVNNGIINATKISAEAREAMKKFVGVCSRLNLPMTPMTKVLKHRAEGVRSAVITM